MRTFKRLILGLIVNVVALYFCQWIIGYFFNDFYLIGDQKRIIFFALILTLVNFLIKPLLRFIFLPLIWITLGLFTLVINIVVLKIANFLLPTIVINTFIGWLLGSIIISFFNSLLYL
ncbi:MAG TPA: phage holin family protein [Candidatus Paceibacterota bacterium]|jgi:putative membrane protein|nr:phage holin family protein [Candidatus Paceibacterota bacterium]HOQ15214.1 phage holin family protein [Candidatus Paceibacterota bacterium]HPQ22768.1 phage holin family protein [Candidatus Paceibacterota bacterium]